MRILTFNWHEAYICTLAKTGHAFDVVERMKGGSRIWFYETRPLPANARIVKERTARRLVREGAYDAMICHNVQDLLWAQELPVPKVLVFHNQLTTEIALGGNTVAIEDHRREVQKLVAATEDVTLVFISGSKAADWGLAGEVITPGIDLADYGGYTGELQRVLRVGNFMKARDCMLGHTQQRAILRGTASTLLGLNDPEPDADVRFTRGWDDLKDCFRRHRLFLNTTLEGFEDGYNLAMLEAMATGMPVVSLPNRSSPLVDGENGFVSSDLDLLHERIERLLADPVLARRLGEAARETIAERFAIDDFARKWNRVLAGAVSRRTVRRPTLGIAAPSADVAETENRGCHHFAETEIRGCHHIPANRARKKVLLSYVSYPATTARYIEDAMRRTHDVLTLGPSISAGLIKAWNLEKMGEPVKPHDLPCGPDVDVRKVAAALPEGWRPDLFLWVESVNGFAPRQIPKLECPTACYLIDSHMSLSYHLEWARRFDHVFVAQREYITQFLDAGCSRVHWLPLACDPAMHGRVETPKLHDIGFVGSLTEHHVHRQEMLGRLARRFDVHVERAFLGEMARIFSASRLVYNDAVKRDLNMRVFEALCSGSMVLTDRAAPSGLDELFTDREHLVIYDDDTIEDLAAYYLAHEDERERIAAAGRAEVLRRHTYDHRVATMLETVFGPDAAETIDMPLARLVEDPLLLEAHRLLTSGAPVDAAQALALAMDRRELSAWERLQLHQTVASVAQTMGRADAAQEAFVESLRSLPPEDRQILQAACR